MGAAPAARASEQLRNVPELGVGPVGDKPLRGTGENLLGAAAEADGLR